MQEESIKSMKSHMKKGITLNANMCVQGGGRLKNWSKDTYVINGWPQKNVVDYFLCIGPAKYTRPSLHLRKMPLFFSIIITITLSYAIIRIYTILHISLQVSETGRLAELH